MMKQCKDCRWWMRGERWGDCRRHSPIVTKVDTPDQTSSHLVTRWPQTMFSQGCGDFEPEEPKG